MSLTSENILVLMAYADGELEGDERMAAQELLATEPDAVRFVEQVADLGDLVERGHEDRSAETIAKFDVADSVMSRIALEKDVKPAATTEKVASLADARDARDARERRGKAPTAKEQRGSNLKIGAGIAAALALAASVFVFAHHRTEETPMAKAPTAPAPQVTQVTQVVAQGTGTPAPATTVGGAGVEVSTENSPSNSVSVFYLPSANELSTSVVVWVDETGEK